jgi:hypothetical protein
MRNLEEVTEELMTRIEACADTQELDFLEDRIWEMRCEARDAQDDELVVVYDRAIEHLAEVRFALACDTTP